MNDVLISLFTNGYDDGNICSMEDLVFSNNKLNISDPMRITMQFRIDKTDTYHGFLVENNSFLNTYGNSGGEQFYKTDIKITRAAANDAGEKLEMLTYDLKSLNIIP